MNVKPMDSIISSILGGLGFIIFFLFLNVSPVISLVIGVGIFIVALFAFTRFDPSETKKREREEKEQSKINEIQAKLNRLKNLKSKNSLKVANEIYNSAIQSYKKIMTMDNYYAHLISFESHVDTAINVMQKYTEILSSGIETDNMNKTREKVEEMLEQISLIFANQFEKFHEQDMIAMDAELSAVQEVLDIETSFLNNREEY